MLKGVQGHEKTSKGTNGGECFRCGKSIKAGDIRMNAMLYTWQLNGVEQTMPTKVRLVIRENASENSSVLSSYSSQKLVDSELCFCNWQEWK